MVKMKIECGTYKLTEFEIDIRNYGMISARDIEEDDAKKAFDLLHETMNDDTFIDDGYRNNDAVNSCIALHVLGYDPEEWFNNFFDLENQDSKFFEADIVKFMEHVERVCEYIHRWGPKGHEERALEFAIY